MSRAHMIALVALAVIAAGSAVWPQGEVAPPDQRLTVVGTLVSIERVDPMDKTSWRALRLRVDERPKDTAGPEVGEELHINAPAPKLRRIGLGDQVRAIIAPQPEPPTVYFAEEITRLGRGEFLNPAEKATLDLGPPEAKVLVKLFAPIGAACHQRTVDLLKELAAAEPQRLRVQIFDMYDPAARAEVNRERLTCATVLVNNRYQFTIKQADQERKVEMTHRPNAEKSTYNSEDVPVVVRQEIARIYEPSKPRPQDQQAPAEPAESGK